MYTYLLSLNVILSLYACTTISFAYFSVDFEVELNLTVWNGVCTSRLYIFCELGCVVFFSHIPSFKIINFYSYIVLYSFVV